LQKQKGIAMPVLIECPSCETQLRVGQETRGKKIRCPKCQEVFKVPAASSAATRRRPADDADDENGRFSAKPAASRRPRLDDTYDDDDVPRRSRRHREDDDDVDDEPRRSSRRQKSSALPWILAGSGVGVLVLGGVILAVVLVSKRGGAGAKQPVAPAQVQAANAPLAAPNLAPDQPPAQGNVPNPGDAAAPIQPGPDQPAPPVPMAEVPAPDTNGAPPPGWALHNAQDNSFSVWLPNRGGRRSERTRSFTGRGMRLKLNIVQLDASGGPTFSAATITLSPNVIRKISLQHLIEIMRDAFLEEVKGTVIGEQEIQLDNARGREYLISAGQSQARMRAYTRGARIYHAAVLGAPQQVQSVEANTFFSSYRLAARVVAASPKPGQQPKGAGPKGAGPMPPPSPGVPPPTAPSLPGQPAAANAIKITGDVFAFAQAAVKENRLAEIDVRGFTVVPARFRHIFDDGGVLIGFEVGYGKFLNNATINALRPIYRTKDGEKMGPWHGPAPASPATFKAKAGYVVGGMKVGSSINLDGFSLTFTRLGNDGLDLKDSYTSEWAGGSGQRQATIGGQGALFVGITGHLNHERIPCALGLIAVTPKQ
jgi:predicted Zn finger-like uncharacterized protein